MLFAQGNSAPEIAESRFWCAHFEANRARANELLRDDPRDLTPNEFAAIEKSVQQFQFGEGSKGRRLLKRGLAYARGKRDRHFARALRLFIQEENRHSGYLLHFMRQHGIAPARHHWVDSIFRVLRGLAGLELSLRVLVTAETIAIPYYRALYDSTQSPLLQAICLRILQEEAAHLRYQASMLARIGAGRIWILARFIARLHRIFLTGTLFVVWIEHGPVFRAAGYAFLQFAYEAHQEFRGLARASILSTHGREALNARCEPAVFSRASSKS